jgi:DNA-binding HxlR family transcriptional regulator
MKKTSLDILLNPVRMGIVQSLIGDRRLSSQQISELMPHVPQATLYRHLNTLLKEGFISVVEVNQVRGTTEKIYSLNGKSMEEANNEAAGMTASDHKQYFLTYLLGLMDEMERYVNVEGIDIKKDGLSYSRGKYFMTDEEFSAFMHNLSNLFGSVIRNTPSPDRKARTFGFISIPDGQKYGETAE